MLRFLILVSFFWGLPSVRADDVDVPARSFSERHVYPVLKKGSDHQSGLTFLAGALLTTMAREKDDDVRAQWVRHQKISKDDSYVGDLLGTGAFSLLMIEAQYLWDPAALNYQSHLRGFVYGGIAIYALKTAFGRNRPGLSNSHQSFPSGHTAITFMTATHVAQAYGWKWGLVAYPLAAFTGATRLSDDAHWFSDTVGGAILGYLVGRATYYDTDRPYGDSAVDQVGKLKPRYDLLPVIGGGHIGLNATISF